ncbi:MAG TPA: hypothetical protein VNW92_11120 [Polyangiaceae bacterium]|nr:hypothetical protein [Polyangiaceae bacterium]
MRAAAAFLAGLLAAALAAWPAALRFEPGQFWQAFPILLAGAALVMAPLSAALAAAGPPGRFARALTVGTLISALPLIPFATVLRTHTHHRPLGGVTFAFGAGAVVVAATLVSARFITWAGDQPSAQRTVARVAIVASSALGAAAVLLGLLHGLRGDPAFRTGFFDALRVLGLSSLAAWLPLPGGFVRRAWGLGLAAWLAVVTVGVCLGCAPTIRAEIAERCPVLNWPLHWLGG